MTHLPECDEPYYRELFARPDDSAKCFMCQALRSCEARMLDAYSVRTSSWMQGVDAARDAVAAALEAGLATSTDGALYYFELSNDPDWPGSGHDVTFHKESLLSAIDNLREGK